MVESCQLAPSKTDLQTALTKTGWTKQMRFPSVHWNQQEADIVAVVSRLKPVVAKPISSAPDSNGAIMLDFQLDPDQSQASKNFNIFVVELSARDPRACFGIFAPIRRSDSSVGTSGGCHSREYRHLCLIAPPGN